MSGADRGEGAWAGGGRTAAPRGRARIRTQTDGSRSRGELPPQSVSELSVLARLDEVELNEGFRPGCVVASVLRCLN